MIEERFTFTNRFIVALMNGLWFVLGGGVLSALLWLLAGCLLALTVVGIPFAVASFRIARFAAFPFGRRLVEAEAIGETQLPGAAGQHPLGVPGGVLAGHFPHIGGIRLLRVDCRDPVRIRPLPPGSGVFCAAR